MLFVRSASATRNWRYLNHDSIRPERGRIQHSSGSATRRSALFQGNRGEPPRDIASTIPHQKRWVEDAEVSSLARDEAAEDPNGPFDLCAPREPAAQADVV